MAAELRVIDANGGYGEILPDWSELTFSQDLISPGTLTFRYPLTGRNAEYLAHGVILAVLLDGVEPINGRFTYFEGDGSRLAGDVVSGYGCTSNLVRFNKMMLAPAFGSTFADENLFAFTNKTAGWLVYNAIDNSRSRSNQLASNPTWFTYPPNFSDVLDSSGAVWPTTYDARFASGTSVSDVLDWVTTNGFAEAYMDKKVLKLLRPENNGRDLSVGANPIILQTGHDFLEASYQTTSADLVTALLVLGENNTCAWVYDTDAMAIHGYREGTLSVSNASTSATLTAAGQAFLSTRKIPRYSYTYSVSALYLEQNNAGNEARPFIDYQVGDSILILDGQATAVQRIRLLSATWPNSRAATVALSVNDFFAEKDVIFAQRLNRLGLTST